MNLAFLDAVLISSLSIPLIMGYRILPAEGTNYIYFTVIFLLLFSNILISAEIIKVPKKKFERIKKILTVTILVLVLGGVMWTSIADRGRIAPGQNYDVHDVVLQTEAALRYLSDGKNPYKETYFGTPLEAWNYGEGQVNPALYHFVMPPFYLVFSYPFFFVSMRTLGFFDGRMPLLFLVLSMIPVIYYLCKNKSIFRLTAVLVLLNPATVHYLIEGRSDYFSLGLLLISLLLLYKGKFTSATVIFSLAVLSKQTIWFMVPFWFAYLFSKYRKSYSKTVKQILMLFLVCIIFCTPFILWDWRAYLDSTVFYLNGSSAHGYPVSGYGLGMVLKQLGVIRNVQDYYPFIIWQIVLGVFSFIWGIKKILKSTTLGNLVLAHAISLSLIWYVSRYFNNSHAGYISTLFILAYFLIQDEKGKFSKTDSGQARMT